MGRRMRVLEQDIEAADRLEVVEGLHIETGGTGEVERPVDPYQPLRDFLAHWDKLTLAVDAQGRFQDDDGGWVKAHEIKGQDAMFDYAVNGHPVLGHFVKYNPETFELTIENPEGSKAFTSHRTDKSRVEFRAAKAIGSLLTHDRK